MQLQTSNSLFFEHGFLLKFCFIIEKQMLLRGPKKDKMVASEYIGSLIKPECTKVTHTYFMSLQESVAMRFDIESTKDYEIVALE